MRLSQNVNRYVCVSLFSLRVFTSFIFPRNAVEDQIEWIVLPSFYKTVFKDLSG